MAWCPKCKNEYRKGITVCAECGCELVEEEESVSQARIFAGTSEQAEELKRFLEYNDLKGVTVSFEKEEEIYFLSVQEKDKAKAQKIARVFVEQKVKEELLRREMEAKQMAEEESSDDGDNEEESAERPVGSYMNSAQMAEDNRSSAWMLLIVGGLGIVAVVLGILDILPLRIGNPYLFYGVLSAVFALFIVMGFVSMKSAKVFEKNAENEKTLKKSLLEWCEANLKAEQIDSLVKKADPYVTDISEMAEEVLYLKRYEVIREMINHQFMNLDQEFVGQLIDETIYDMIFSAETI